MKKILIVEDDTGIAIALSIRLKSSGYEVLSAPDSITGLGLAVKFRPDLALLDVGLPAGDGIVLAERINSLTTIPYLPIIFMTASRQPGVRQRAMAAGAVGFFEKPYDPDELLEAIRQVVGDTPNS